MTATPSKTIRRSFIRRMFSAPVFEDDEDKTRIGQLLHVLLLSLSGVILFFATIEIAITGVGTVLVAAEITGLIYLGLWGLMRRGHVRLVSVLTVSLFLLSTTMLIYFTGTIRTSITAFYIVCVVIAGLLLGNRGTSVSMIMSLLALGGLLTLEIGGKLPAYALEPANPSQWFTYAGILSVIAILLSLSTRSLNRALARAHSNEQSLSQSNRELQAIRESLEDRVKARTAQLHASAEVGRTAASTLNPDELIHDVANLITDRFGFYYTAIFTLDPSGRFAVLREATGKAGRILKERHHQLEIGSQSMVSAAITTRKPRIALDVGLESVRFANPLLPETRSEIALPLIVGDQAFGALDVQSTQAAAFDESSASVLQAMADQIAIALNNARTFVDAQVAADRARALYRASQQIGQLDTDLTTLLNDIMRTIGESAGFNQWLVTTFDDRHERLAVMAAHAARVQQPSLHVADQPDHPLVRSAVRGETIIVNDSRAQTVTVGFGEGLGKFVSTPIAAGGRTLGALIFGHPHDGPDWTDRDRELAESIASLIVVAIENRNLLQQTQHATQELTAINRRLTGEGWRSVTRRTTGGILWVSSSDRAEHELMPEITEALASGQIATRPTRSVIDAQGHTVGGEQQVGIAIPIKLRDVPIGVLRLVMPQSAWDNEMSTTLESIAGHAAQSAENARLLAVTEERFARERVLAESTDKIRRKSDVERILQTAAEELARHLQAARVAVHIDPQAEANGDRL